MGALNAIDGRCDSCPHWVFFLSQIMKHLISKHILKSLQSDLLPSVKYQGHSKE